jgi:YesN/AraC family two-component response regulator
VLNGTEHRLTDNCLFLITPNDYHRIEAQNTHLSSSTVISFSEIVVDKEIISSLAFCPRIWYNVSNDTLSIIEALTNVYFQNDKRREQLLNHLLNAMLCTVLDNAAKLKTSNDAYSPLILRAMTMVLTDVSAEVTLHKIAKECNITPSYFSALFRKEVGKTFMIWLTEIRIGRAKWQLSETDTDILNICYDCGYNTPSQFIKMFKRETGLTPSEYRKRNSSSK